MTKLPTFPLNLNNYELGFLSACVSQKDWDLMPRSLWLKLKIQITKCYLEHPTFGSQAKLDIERWEKELKTT